MLVTHLRVKVELRKQPHLADRPAVIVDRSKGRPLVVDTFPAAVGVSAGMTPERPYPVTQARRLRSRRALVSEGVPQYARFSPGH